MAITGGEVSFWLEEGMEQPEQELPTPQQIVEEWLAEESWGDAYSSRTEKLIRMVRELTSSIEAAPHPSAGAWERLAKIVEGE